MNAKNYLIAVTLVSFLSTSPRVFAGTIPKGFAARDAEVNGTRIHYLIGGKGSPIVLLHGYAQTGHMWKPIMPLLAADHTVIVPDLRGAGESSKPESGYDKKNMAVDIHDLVVSLGFKRASVVGHDIGLMVAYAYAAQFPRETERLVLMDAFLPGVGDWKNVWLVHVRKSGCRPPDIGGMCRRPTRQPGRPGRLRRNRRIRAHRGIKKLRAAGALGPDRLVAVFGVGGLGAYAVQYARLLGGGATVIAFARHPEKLAIAKEYGADHVISTHGKSTADIRKELRTATGKGELDAVIDCAGAAQQIRMGFELLATGGHYASVGLVGDQIDIPLFPFVAREYTYHGSFWGNYNDLSEIMTLASQGKIRHTVKPITLEQVNETIDLLRAGEIVGRAVIRF